VKVLFVHCELSKSVMKIYTVTALQTPFQYQWKI